jgi:Flp pilus assembly protein TadG
MSKWCETARCAPRKAQAVVEFALVLPVFLLLLMGAVEFGRAYLRLHLLTNAAREGARTGSLPGSTKDNVEDTVNSFLTGAGMESGTWTTTITVTDSNGSERSGGLDNAQQGDRVRVEITHNLEVLSGTLIPGWSGSVPLKATCTFRHE